MVLAVVAVLVGAVAQATSGLGFGLICAPALIATMGHAEGVATVVLLSAFLNAVMVVRERRHVRYAAAAVVVVPAALATPLLVLLVDRMGADTAAFVAGVLTVIAAAALLSGLRVPALRGRVGGATAGVLSATTNAIAGIGGPPVALYGANADWPAASIRATMQAIFLLLNVALLLVRGLPSPPARLFVSMAAGYLLGVLLTRWMSDRTARTATLILAAAGGAVLAARGVL